MQTLTVKALHGFTALSNEELMYIDAGKWSWKDFSTWTGTTAAAGGVAGATVGATAGSAVPGAGTAAGACTGAACGFVGGAVLGATAYTIYGWWDD